MDTHDPIAISLLSYATEMNITVNNQGDHCISVICETAKNIDVPNQRRTCGFIRGEVVFSKAMSEVPRSYE